MRKVSTSASNSSTDDPVAFDPASRVPVAYVRRAHGLTGAMVVRPLDGTEAGRFSPGAVFAVENADSPTLTVAKSAQHPDGLLVSFEEITDRDGAEPMRGATLTIDRSERRALDEDEYWDEDLIGRTAVNTSGSELGTVASVIFAEAQDRIAVVTSAGEEVEVPFVSAIVVEVPAAPAPIVIDPPDGLFP